MILSMESQVILFVTTVAVGFATGLLYDFFRIIRLTFKHPNFLIHIEDILYWLIAAFLMFYIMLFRNYGEIRLFSIIGVFIGMAVYFLTISRLIMNLASVLINFLKKVISFLITVILFPFKLILKIFSYPVKLLLNIYKSIHKSIKKVLQKSGQYAKIRMRKTKDEFKIILNKH